MDKITLNITINSDYALGTAYSVYKSCGLLAQDYYHKKGFIAITEKVKPTLQTIVIPGLGYKKDFWATVKEYKQGSVANNKKILDFLKANVSIDVDKISKRKNEISDYIRTIQKPLETYVSQTSSTKGNLNIEVFIVETGSLCSFIWPQKGEKSTPTVILRTDTALPNLVEGILSAILIPELNKTYSWNEREAIIDYLTAQFLLTIDPKQAKEYKKTIDITNNQTITSEILKNSRDFLQKNNLHFKQIIQKKSARFAINENHPTQKYSEREMKTVIAFLNKWDSVLTYDEIANLIWGDKADDKYSTWAINKHIQRIREKLYLEGTSKGIIKSVRGVGYFLNN